MKLTELLEYNYPKMQVRRRKSDLRDLSAQTGGADYQEGEIEPEEANDVRKQTPILRRNPKVKLHGSGAFSSVYSHEDRPHDVRKVSKVTHIGEADGFYYYVKAISKSKDYTNPYFPKVRSMREYKSAGKEHMYTVQMERLFPVTTLNDEQTEALSRKIFGDQRVGSPRQFAYEIERLHMHHRWRVSNKDKKKVDPDLKRALRLIRRVAERYELTVDLHSYNVMVRHSPYGPQLVITDPLSSP